MSEPVVPRPPLLSCSPPSPPGGPPPLPGVSPAPLPSDSLQTPLLDARALVADNLDRALQRSETLVCTEEQRRTAVRDLITSSFRPWPSSRDLECGEADERNGTYIISMYRHIRPVVQRGPSCGLIALNMAQASLTGISLDPTEVLNRAVEMNFTRKGEMFSAEDLLTLARLLTLCQGRMLGREQDVETKRRIIIDELRRGSVVLIPYPFYESCVTDSPCVVQNVNKCEYESLKTHSACAVDTAMPNLLHVISNLFLLIPMKDDEQQRTTFVYAVHGRSISCRLWSLDSILASNAQLKSLDPQIERVISDYIIPVDGIEAGLCGQVIVLSKET